MGPIPQGRSILRASNYLPKSKLNTELYIFCCTAHQKCTDLHLYTVSQKNDTDVTHHRIYENVGGCVHAGRPEVVNFEHLL